MEDSLIVNFREKTVEFEDGAVLIRKTGMSKRDREGEKSQMRLKQRESLIAVMIAC